MIEVAVLCPVLGRPHRATPLAASLKQATTVPHHLVFVCSPDDHEQIVVCAATDAFVLVADWQPGAGDYAMKINLAYRQTTAPFVFTGADDLDFQPGWDVAALERIESEEMGVCGTNDGFNPAVKSGRHSTHSLVRRAYIDECGGTFEEEPGVLYSTAYDHQSCDNELVYVAQDRGCFTFAADSRVTHLHPFWNGRRGMDATYEKGLLRGREDRRLYEVRRRAYERGQRVGARA